MANYKAVASGNWSNLAIWQDDSTGSFVASTVLPGASDVVYWNNFTVAIDQDVTVSQIRSDSATGVTAGGTGTVSTSRTINANITSGSATATLTISAGAGSTVNVNGDTQQITSGLSTLTINIIGTSTVNFVGNITLNQISVTQFAAISPVGISVGAGATLNMTGNVYSGLQNTDSGGNSRGISCTSNSIVNVVGNVHGGVGGKANYGIAVNGNGVNISVTGNVYGGTSTNVLSQNSGIAIIGALINVIVNTTGILEAGSNSPSLLGPNNTTGQFRHTGIINQGANGFSAVLAPFFFIENNPSQYEFRRSNLTINTLYTFDLSDNPSTNNVRSGIAYGPANIFVGTCAVPPANTVSLGVPVDNTVGTASLDANALAIALDAALTTSLDASLSASLPAAIAPLLWDEDVANITTPNSIGERLKNCATVATTGAQISSFNP